MRLAERAHGTVGILPETIAGALAYFFLPAILFLLVEPYNRNRFVRFHSFQCLGIWLLTLIIGALLRIVSIALLFLPVVGQMLVWLLSMLISLALFMIWIVLVVKALQGRGIQAPIDRRLRGTASQ
jgi:uncharacterized membrane protein